MKKSNKKMQENNIPTGLLLLGNAIENILCNINSKRQVKYFKKMGCEVYEVGPDGKERKLIEGMV